MAIHSSILAWRIPWTEEPDGLQSMGSQESDMTQRLNSNNKVSFTMEGCVGMDSRGQDTGIFGGLTFRPP